MSAQDTSFEALAASPGDFALDSEWMGDSPPALTVDFIQNQNNHLRHVQQIERLKQQRQQQQHQHQPQQHQQQEQGAGVGNPGIGKGQLLVDDPSLTLSQPPPPASSPESFISSYQDSSSDISSKQTSVSVISGYTNGTTANKSRGRPRETAKVSPAGTVPPHKLPQQFAAGIIPDDVMMSDGLSLQAVDGDGATPNWSFRDYLQGLDDDQDNDENGTTKTEGDILGTIDPKSTAHSHSNGFGSAQGPSGDDAHGPNGSSSSYVNAASQPDLSPYSGGRSPLDFVSATSSPPPDDIAIPNFSTAQLFSASAAGFTSPMQSVSGQQARRGHSKAASQYSLSQSMNDLKTSASREVSPVANFVFGQGPSPQAYMQASQSPIDTNDYRFGFLQGSTADPMQVPPGFLFPDGDATSPTSTWAGNALHQQQQQQHHHHQQQIQQQQQQIMNGMAPQMPVFHHSVPAAAHMMSSKQQPLRFSVGIDPHKSRVETQIPVTILLSTLPPGVTKLHLPPHTISKPKLLSKNPVEPSPDMLELYTMVVCTSAMQNDGNRRRALERAAAATHEPQAAPVEGDSNDDNDECRPANGGEIWICKGCIQRERKRANRKKSKKPEDDEEWSREEHRRIIIFNTNEVKDWQRPTPNTMLAHSDNASIVVPMRITCYCRHHGEKTGFQVIFTLKDFRGQVIAQTLSRSVMITDDHKTPTAPSAGSASAAASVADGDGSAGDPQDTAKSSTSTTPISAMNGTFAKASKTVLSPSMGQPKSDFSGLKRGSVTFLTPQPAADNASNALNGAASQQAAAAAAAGSARELSRPASPNGLKGHFSKKRKSSAGVPKVPASLAMTRMETSPQQPAPRSLPGRIHGHAASTSPVAQFSSNGMANANGNPFLSSSAGFVPDGMSAAVDMALMAGGSGDRDMAIMVPIDPDSIGDGPLTPNSHTDQANMFSNSNTSNGIANTNGNRSGSLDALALSQAPFFSAPTSAHPSRAPSPNGMRSSMQMFQQQLFQQQQQQLQQQLNQAQFPQAFPASLFNLPMALSQAATSQTSQPVIHKVIPAEGPKSGGIEVTILGSAFYQGLDVMFGDQRATTTTFWGESSLVCLVPPSPISGHVPVTLRQSNQRGQPFTAPTQQRITFKYLDDDEQQLLRAALTVLSRKMTGKIEDAQDVARRIIGSETSNWGTGGGGNSGSSTTGSTRSVAASVAELAASGAGGSPNFETHLLKVLELIDLDDSPNQTSLNLQRRTTGHSMLHLACVLGMHRFVAGLLARGANPDVRDKGGYTPLHLAALNNQPEIVRRLIHAGADPTMRTLSGLTASEVAASREVLRAIKKLERHNRSRSGGSLHSRTSSAASLRSLWEPMTMSAMPTIRRRASGTGVDGSEDAGDSENSSRAEVDSSSYAASGDDEGSSGGQDEEGDEDWLDMRSGSHVVSRSSRARPSSRRGGARDMSPSSRPSKVVAVAGADGAEVPAGLASPAAAAVSAFRDQLSAHFQQLVAQIPQMQIPNNPLPDYYQAYLNSGAFQRISSLVPNINISGAMGSRPNSSGDSSGSAKDLESRWWDLSSLMATGAAPPPAYEEIFPHQQQPTAAGDVDTKQATAAAAAAEAEADTKCAALYDTHTHAHTHAHTHTHAEVEKELAEAMADELVADAEGGDFAAASTTVLQIGRKHQITKEQQDNFRRVHQEKRKGLGSDTFLYTVWIPILLGVLLLWLSGARAWDFFPSVTFNVPYATSLGSPMRPTGTAHQRSKDSAPGTDAKQAIVAPPPAVAAVPVAAGPDDVVAVVEGIVA